ncbi:hypothetical protein DSL72_003102 [Monilinia vaccinii-corymbosi]|uniref:Histidine kinase n=1 Tax=Monilinia vaccinii-corymbosi TaxID=61207 RepID=A0A8A3NT22_9HELO|nr:hypothetical protein DSL72_003102 [Monilinia vaccinii-corymbosi]
MHGEKNAKESRSPGSNQVDIDLQLSILKYLPTPVLVLDQNRKTLWVNRKAGALLGNSDSSTGSDGVILGKNVDELGARLSNDRSWAPVLDNFELSRSGDDPRHDGDLTLPSVLDGVVNDAFEIKDHHISFRVNIEVLSVDHGVYFILSFELRDSANLCATSASTPNEERRRDSSTARMKERNFCHLRKAVFDNIDKAAFLLTADEGFYLSNRKARDILGDDMGGKNGCDGAAFRATLIFWDEAYDHQLSPDEHPGTVLIRTQQPFAKYRCGIVHPISGDRMITLITGECLCDETTGTFLGAIFWCEDIQDFGEYLIEKQQTQLRSHETICDLIPHLVWTTTPDGHCDWYSRRWYEYTGLSKEECLETGYRRVVHPEDLSLLVEKWAEARRVVKDCEIEIRYRRHDGVYRWMQMRACPLLDNNGNVLKWYGTNTDITDTVISRIEAKRNKHQILSVLAHAEVNLFCVNENSLITMVEGGMLWGTKTEQPCLNKASFIGKNIIEVMRSTQSGGVPEHENSILELLAGKIEMKTCEERIGGRSYRTRLVADLEHNSDNGGQGPKVIGCFGLSIDITDVEKRAQLEMDNTRLIIEEQAAKDSSKMKSQFLANGIIGMVDLLSEDATLTTSQREYVSSIKLSGRALLSIVNDILDFSKIESGRLDIEEVPFNLFSTVTELCKLLSIFAHQKNIEFMYENEFEESLEVVGDPGRIRQVLSNLLTNALKYTENGSITISGKGKRIPQSNGIRNDRIELANLMSGTITLESEQGVGSTATFTIPLKISSYCGYPQYFTAPTQVRFPFTDHNSNRSSRSGSVPSIPHLPNIDQGPMRQQIINEKISTSDTNHVLPPDLRDGKSKREDGIRLSVGERAEFLILVVEDNAINQTIALKTIRNLGFQATAVWNGREALSYLSNPGPSKPKPDIILMDVQMPIMDGYEATRILRTNKEFQRDWSHSMDLPGATRNVVISRSADNSTADSKSPDSRIEHKLTTHQTKGKVKDIPIIAMTASAIQGDQEKCLEAGMDGYLSKPVEKARLEETLLHWVEKVRKEREHTNACAPGSDAKHGKSDSGVMLEGLT